MDGNALSVKLQTVNLAEVLSDVTPALQSLAEKLGHRCTIAVSAPARIRGYESLLFRLIFNLGENAVKYTPGRRHD